MKKIFTLVVVMALVGIANAQKIGVVSADDVFANMSETRKADSSLAAYQKGLQEAYQDSDNELQSALEKFVRDSAKMTQATKEMKRKDLEGRIANMQNKQQELNQMLEAQKEKELKPIREKMLKAIQEVAKESGYTYVLYKEQLIVFPDADDITDKVKTKLKIKLK